MDRQLSQFSFLEKFGEEEFIVASSDGRGFGIFGENLCDEKGF